MQFAKNEEISFIGIQFAQDYTAYKYVQNAGTPYALYLDKLLEDYGFDEALNKIINFNIDQVDHIQMSPEPARTAIRQNMQHCNGSVSCYDTGFDETEIIKTEVFNDNGEIQQKKMEVVRTKPEIPQEPKRSPKPAAPQKKSGKKIIQTSITSFLKKKAE